jgi:hypothetical protein
LDELFSLVGIVEFAGLLPRAAHGAPTTFWAAAMNGRRWIGDQTHDVEHILGTMIDLACQKMSVRLVSFPFGDVEAPTTFPSASLIGETVSKTSSRFPSLRRRTVS